MAYEKPLFSHSRKAGGDLSTKQYHFVKLDSNGDVVICAAITDIPFGVVQNAPASGETAEVMQMGISKIVCDGTIAVGSLVGTSTDGQADAIAAGTDTTVYAVARYIGTAAAAASDIGTFNLNCLVPTRAA